MSEGFAYGIGRPYTLHIRREQDDKAPWISLCGRRLGYRTGPDPLARRLAHPCATCARSAGIDLNASAPTEPTDD